MSYWSAFASMATTIPQGVGNTVSRLLAFRSRVPSAGDIYISEVSAAEIAVHLEPAPSWVWQKLSRRWRKALRLDPISARILNNLGVAYEQQGSFELARESYHKALELDPDNAYIRRNYELFRKATEKATRDSRAFDTRDVPTR